MQEEAIIGKLLEKYLKGEASADDINQINKWYDSFDFKPDLYLPGSFELHKAIAKGFSELKLKLRFE